jgi:hypothetical protein
MKNQIFKTLVPPEVLWDFLKENTEKSDDYLIFNKSLYKKAVFRNTLTPFLKQIEPYYHASKKQYIMRKMDYTKFITIIRQICNTIGIEYTKTMEYNKSTYEIVYAFFYIGLNDVLVPTDDCPKN